MIGLDGAPVAPGSPIPQTCDRVGLGGDRHRLLVGDASAADLVAYRRMRHDTFVSEQGIFERTDADDIDGARSTVVLVARDQRGEVLGGVRVAPVGDDPGGGWWAGSRLVVRPDHRRSARVGAALVRAACARVEQEGALRFDAAVQLPARLFFERLGWLAVGTASVGGHDHAAMRWPIGRAAALVERTKVPIATILAGLRPGGPGWVGDDAAPIAGSDLLAACDAIVPAMVERDPAWAGWCGVLVNVNDLTAMGAEPVGLLDAVAAPTVTAASRIVAGLRAAAEAWGVPIVGGHTQVGVPSALSVTALGRCSDPVPGGGGRPGDEVRVTADLTGGWRPGYRGAQWDSTTARTPGELRRLAGTVARLRPAAAKDVSMGGIVGTLGMLAEAGGCGAELDVAAVPRPPGAALGDWSTCFPGFAMVTADRPGRAPSPPDVAPATTAVCGRLTAGAGVTLVWPDGERTVALPAGVTGLGAAG